VPVKSDQTITFDALGDVTVAQSPVTAVATATSGLPVTFSTTTPSVCTAGGANGATITLLMPGTCTVQADQPGDDVYNPAPPVVQSFTVFKVTLSLTTSLSGGGSTGPQIAVLENTAVTDTATLTGTGASAATGAVTYTVYADSSCRDAVSTGDTEPVGNGTTPTSSAVTLTAPGIYYWQAAYGGDSRDNPVIGACGNEVETVFAPNAAGAFVIGDTAQLAVGAKVTFWGDQWSQRNPLSNGTAASSFKGFTDNPASPACGARWSTQPGNSSAPPARLPSQILVIVTNSATQTGSLVSGNIIHVIMVNVDPGYGPAPGHNGTGKIASVIC
jgi:hypothetical protein